MLIAAFRPDEKFGIKPILKAGPWPRIVSNLSLRPAWYRVSRLSENTKVGELAETIVSKCKLIHPQKIPELEQLLAFLQKRMESKEFRQQQAQAAKMKKRSLMDHAQTEEHASIAEIDEYVSLLYEDTKEKIRGTALILQVRSTARHRGRSGVGWR